MHQQYGVVIGVALMAALGTRAADRTWTGGGSDANWSTAANWGGTAPTAGDALVFAGTAGLTNANDLAAGTAFGGLSFAGSAGAFVLAGNGATLAGHVTNATANAQTINLPLALGSATAFNTGTGSIALNGAVTGAGGITKQGGGTLYVAASNAYDGATVIGTGTVVITHGNALGTTNGNTTVDTLSRGSLELRGGITVGEPLVFTGGSVNGNCVLNGTGTNTLSGPVTTSGGRYNANTGTWLKFTGGVTGPNPFFVVNANGTIEFTTTPLNLGTGTFHCDSGGLTILGIAGNVWGGTLFTGGTLRMNATNAFPATTTLQIGGVSYGPNATLDLNGFDQTIAGITRAGTSLGTIVIGSAVPATLTLNLSSASTYEGQLAGLVSLVKTGAGSLTLTNMLSSTMGAFVISNGSLVAASTARLGNSTNIVVVGGTLELQGGSALQDSATLSIQSGGKLKVNAGISERVDKLVLAGVQQISGTYGSSSSGALFTNDTYFSGTGQLVVWSSPPVSVVNATWDGGGANTLVDTPANWTNDVAPAFDGTAYATFATGGATATVDRALGFYGMCFNRDGNFTLTAGGGVLTNGAGGIYAQVPNTTGRTYTLASDVVLGDNQIWCITNNGTGGTTFNVTGRIDDGPIPYCITKTEFGTLALSSSNSFDGAVVVSNGWLSVYHPNALGSTNGNTVIMGITGGFLYLGNGLTLMEPLVLNGEKNNGGTLRCDSGACVLGGPITIANQVRFQIAGGTLSVTGGVTALDDSGLFVINSSTLITFASKPLNLRTKTFYTDAGGLTVLGVASNIWSDTLVANGTLRLDVPYAIPTNATLRLGIGYGPGGTLNLNGNDQLVSRLYLGTSNPGTRVIASAAPATLAINQSVNDLVDIQFTGAVSVVKGGAGTLTLTNAFTSTTGRFSVTNGTLAVVNVGTLGAVCTNVNVSGSGTLLLSNSVAIANAALVSMPAAGVATAKINLAAGVNETVGWLYYGTHAQRVGTYGSSSSGAVYKDDTHFSGTGVLTVMRDHSGTMVFMR